MSKKNSTGVRAAATRRSLVFHHNNNSKIISRTKVQARQEKVADGKIEIFDYRKSRFSPTKRYASAKTRTALANRQKSLREYAEAIKW